MLQAEQLMHRSFTYSGPWALSESLRGAACKDTEILEVGLESLRSVDRCGGVLSVLLGVDVAVLDRMLGETKASTPKTGPIRSTPLN